MSSLQALQRDAFMAIDDALLVRQVMAATLSERQRQVIVALYGLDGQPAMRQIELAAEWGVSQSRIMQLRDKALKRMKAWKHLPSRDEYHDRGWRHRLVSAYA